MGQKCHPYGFRIVHSKNWHSKWFAKREYAHLLHEDLKLRKELKAQLHGLNAMISKIDIERAADKVTVRIFTARPGIVIGRKGAEIDKLREELQTKLNRPVSVDIQEIKKPEIDAQLVAEGVAQQLERRIAFRRAMRKAEEAAIRFGAKGFKIKVSGRLNGAEIARTEDYLAGQMPLQTIRANVEYGFAEAHTTYGIIGVKVWVNLGEAALETVKR
ncbi:MAG TPA: 30S ribosomal protein S3 [Holophaga sp.]|nr:30S ribosomal protein S3 [Holophaga sp.]HPS67737.1 30S ribosomal protein S3 [Holophaga sp.]